MVARCETQNDRLGDKGVVDDVSVCCVFCVCGNHPTNNLAKYGWTCVASITKHVNSAKCYLAMGFEHASVLARALGSINLKAAKYDV